VEARQERARAQAEVIERGRKAEKALDALLAKAELHLAGLPEAQAATEVTAVLKEADRVDAMLTKVDPANGQFTCVDEDKRARGHELKRAVASSRRELVKALSSDCGGAPPPVLVRTVCDAFVDYGLSSMAKVSSFGLASACALEPTTACAEYELSYCLLLNTSCLTACC